MQLIILDLNEMLSMVNYIGHISSNRLAEFSGRRYRAVASLTVLVGQEFHFLHFFLKFRSIFLIFPQTLLIFFLILALRVGELSPTREGPGYATEKIVVLTRKYEVNFNFHMLISVFEHVEPLYCMGSVNNVSRYKNGLCTSLAEK